MMINEAPLDVRALQKIDFLRPISAKCEAWTQDFESSLDGWRLDSTLTPLE